MINLILSFDISVGSIRSSDRFDWHGDVQGCDKALNWIKQLPDKYDVFYIFFVSNQTVSLGKSLNPSCIFPLIIGPELWGDHFPLVFRKLQVVELKFGPIVDLHK